MVLRIFSMLGVDNFKLKSDLINMIFFKRIINKQQFVDALILIFDPINFSLISLLLLMTGE